MSRISLNNDWKFNVEYKEGMEQPDFVDAEFETVRIPHTVVETPYNYFDESIYQKIAIYRKLLQIPTDILGKKIYVEFGAVGHKADVYVNGILCDTHYSGYTAFKVDITPYVVPGKENLLAVVCDSRENLNIPPFGKVIDYMTYGGMYREVYLNIVNADHIEDVFVMTDVNPEVLRAEITFDFAGEIPENCIAQAELLDMDNNVIFDLKAKVIKPVVHLNRCLTAVEQWNLDNPVLYKFRVTLYKETDIIDEKTIRFGFRTAEFRKDGFYLNGNKVKLFGMNRHQSYPYVGYAMPKGPQQEDALILKNELCLNAVRTSHYTQSQHFIDKCDEIGLLVFTELPGWQYVGNDQWKSIACESVAEMVKQYRNHPSIILWGVRINESGDDDEFYTKTNEIAHSLDPSRATGGVRCFKKSSLLEDVYTYNDFGHVGTNPGVIPKKEATSDEEKGYLISEYGGHMYPTKVFDDEEHRMEHAKRHARVINDCLAEKDIAGSFAWCMFDYNTHQDFGGGDRICYHGVMDMFRNPKPAAYVYASQGEEEDVLFVTSSVEIGDHPSCTVGDFYVFTNADSVRLYKNEQMIMEYSPINSPFPYMKHPPILINDRVGNLLIVNEGLSEEDSDAVKGVLFDILENGSFDNLPMVTAMKLKRVMGKTGLTRKELGRLYDKYVGNWGDLATTYRFEAVKNGQVVNVVKKQPMKKALFTVKADRTKLVDGDTYDVSCVRCEAVDDNSNRLYYLNAPVEFETEGNIEVIGPKIGCFIGGATGTYIKTTGKGEAKLTIKALGQSISVNYTVE